MAPASNEEQFKFLISCIRYSNNGRVDFGKVADECTIISKGAAAKRYERMMRAHGIASNEKAASKAGTPSKSKTNSSSDTPSNPAKKRKIIDDFDDFGSLSNTGGDDDEGFGNMNMRERTNVKSDPEGRQAFKNEDMTPNRDPIPFGFDCAADLLRYYDGHTDFDNSSSLVDPEYNGSEYDSSMSRFMTSCLNHDHTAFRNSSQQQEDVKYPFAQFSNGINPVRPNMHYPALHNFATTAPAPRLINQNTAFRPITQHQSDSQGHSDSPVLVE